MSWTRVKIGTEAKKEETVVVGECNRCFQCCICWIYEKVDQPASTTPRKGWCPELDLEKKACRVWDKRPEGCRNFPTVRDFELGAVPAACGFRLVKGDD